MGITRARVTVICGRLSQVVTSPMARKAGRVSNPSVWQFYPTEAWLVPLAAAPGFLEVEKNWEVFTLPQFLPQSL